MGTVATLLMVQASCAGSECEISHLSFVIAIVFHCFGIMLFLVISDGWYRIALLERKDYVDQVA